MKIITLINITQHSILRTKTEFLEHSHKNAQN